MALQISNWFNSIINPAYERLRDGTHWMSLSDSSNDWDLGDYGDCVNSNPVLFRCIDIIADLVSLAEFRVNDEENENHPLIKLLNNPNEFQSKQDFLKEFIFNKYSYGFVYQYPLKPDGFLAKLDNVDSIYNLNPKGIKYNENFATRLLSRSEIQELKQKQFKYTEKHQERNFNISDVIPFYDTANGLGDDFMMKAKSRLLSIAKPIKNIDVALSAEHTALSQAGTWIISGSSKGGNVGISTGLTGKEKQEMETSFNGFGLAQRKRAIFTDKMLDANSLHTPMSELGIKESVMNNANLIINAFGIPKEVYSIDKSGSTFENQKEAYINLIQNVVQAEVNDLCNSYMSYFDLKGDVITGTFDHVAVMQHIEDKKADKALKLSQVYRNVTDPAVAETIMQIAGINTETDE